MVTAAKRELSVERIALELQLEPRIVPLRSASPWVEDPTDIGSDQAREIVAPVFVRLINAGSGIAEVESVEVSVDGWAQPHRKIFPSLIRPGDEGDIRAEWMSGELVPDVHGVLHVEGKEVEFKAGDALHTTVRYRGAGERRYLAQFTWLLERGDVWRFTLDHTDGHLQLPPTESPAKPTVSRRLRGFLSTKG